MVTSTDVWCPRMDILLNKWFTSYEEAKKEHLQCGGYLLPFKQYCYITTDIGIRELGWDPRDPRWALIGYDWVNPLQDAVKEELLHDINRVD